MNPNKNTPPRGRSSVADVASVAKKRPRVETNNPLTASPHAAAELRSCCAGSLLDLFLSAGAADTGRLSSSSPPPFTLRLEHRVTSVQQQQQKQKHELLGGGGRKEERLLIFRSDRPGAIAKIIYHSNSQPTDGTVQAKILVLECKEAYRGLDLGGFLFSEALESMKKTYSAASTARTSICTVHCQLDAEEDERRHNRLVTFYEELGCSIRDPKKIKFLNNNDGETFRKVPMSIDLLASNRISSADSNREREPNCYGACFLPVNLLRDDGKHFPASPCRKREHWLLFQNRKDEDNATDTILQIRTTTGQWLSVDGSSGSCSLHSCGTDDSSTHLNSRCAASFRLLRISDNGEHETGLNKSSGSCGNAYRIGSLWMMQSVEHGTFLSLFDSKNVALHCQSSPCFWKVVSHDDVCNSRFWTASGNNLQCTRDTPALRQHYKGMWRTQSLQYVRSMKAKYLPLNPSISPCCPPPRLSLRDALDRAQGILADPFSNKTNNNSTDSSFPLSLRALAFGSAEYVRSQGHPDWVQLIALLYYLGRVRVLLDRDDVTNVETNNITPYDWAMASRARVLGCPIPEQVAFGEFQTLRPKDDENEKYCGDASENGTATGIYEPHCGLNVVELTWTGPEYMYHMLQRNGIAVPYEGLAMLRLASLSDWHTGRGTNNATGAYTALESTSDAEMKPMVAEFDRLLCAVARQRSSTLETEPSAADCDALWTSHYADIAGKYNVDGPLLW